MFEALRERVAHIARQRAARRVLILTQEMQAILPDARIEADGDEIRVSGRGLRRRFALDARLRWPGARF